MPTVEQITAELEKPLDRKNVKQRDQGRSKLSYIESWHAIAEANRIFGFDGWNTHTVECKCVAENKRKIGKDQYERDGWGVTYIAKVLVTANGVEREGTGAGHGIDAALGLAHESAIKEAESDARKRALMTYGNPFGLALYDKTQANVATVVDEPSAPVKSSAQLKREGSWDLVKGALDSDFADCHSLVTLSKLRADYREKAKANGWPRAWLDALAEEFDAMERALEQVQLQGAM